MSFFGIHLRGRLHHWLLPLCLLGLLGISYWLNHQAQPEQIESNSNNRQDPDVIVENFSATRLNEQGTPRFVMTAKKMQHFPHDDSTLLETPHLVLLSAEQPAIHASAQRGSIVSKGDEVFLRGDVNILREGSAQQEGIKLQTEYLRVVPDLEWVGTDRAVTVVRAQNSVHATGFEMDNKARTLKLLSQVRSEYVPNTK